MAVRRPRRTRSQDIIHKAPDVAPVVEVIQAVVVMALAATAVSIDTAVLRNETLVMLAIIKASFHPMKGGLFTLVMVKNNFI